MRLPFAYDKTNFSDASTAWVVGNVHNVRVNNAFSPLTGAQQPYGWDQMTALYRRYKVIGFKYRYTVMNMSSTPGYHFVREVPVNENFTMLAATATRCAELPGMHILHVPAAGGPVVSLERTVDIPKLLGITKEQFLADATRYTADVTAAPEFAYVQDGFAGSATTTFVRVLVQVEYTVQFNQRITQAQS